MFNGSQINIKQGTVTKWDYILLLLDISSCRTDSFDYLWLRYFFSLFVSAINCCRCYRLILVPIYRQQQRVYSRNYCWWSERKISFRSHHRLVFSDCFERFKISFARCSWLFSSFQFGLHIHHRSCCVVLKTYVKETLIKTSGRDENQKKEEIWIK